MYMYVFVTLRWLYVYVCICDLTLAICMPASLSTYQKSRLSDFPIELRMRLSVPLANISALSQMEK